MYSKFAYLYDKLTEDIDYKKWADYIQKIFLRYNVSPALVLELACGTGSFSIEFSKRNYDMTSLDISEDMLCVAKEKAMREKQDILWLNQDMASFELYGTVDVILCLLDSINYITDHKRLISTFKLVKNYLNPGGLFIFDINSVYKFENVFNNNVFYSVDDDITYIWENTYDKASSVCRFDLTFFNKNNGLYKRYDEVHYQKAYSVNEIKTFLNEASITHIDTFEALSFKKLSESAERIFFVCR